MKFRIHSGFLAAADPVGYFSMTIFFSLTFHLFRSPLLPILVPPYNNLGCGKPGSRLANDFSTFLALNERLC